MEVSTNFKWPWVLILHGGHVAGQRPRTILACISRGIIVNGQFVSFMVRKYPGGKPTKNLCKIKPEQIMRVFHLTNSCPPPQSMIEHAKKFVKKEQSFDDIIAKNKDDLAIVRG